MELLFKIAGIGMIVLVMDQVLTKSGRDDLALLTSLAGLALAVMMVMDVVLKLFTQVRDAFGNV